MSCFLAKVGAQSPSTVAALQLSRRVIKNAR
jgi:hypothetical protein